MEFIVLLPEIIEQAEKAKGYWDETGLDMHIAVNCDGRIAVSTKHWVRVHYVVTNYSAHILWNMLGDVSKEIGRKLIRSEKGPYVYMHKLNKEQTQEVFDKIVARTKGKVERHMEWSWDISDAFIPEK
jgi:hypothetical protein